MKRYIKSEKVIPTYVGQLSQKQQDSIRKQLESYGLTGKDLEDAMDSKISDITGNPETPITIESATDNRSLASFKAYLQYLKDPKYDEGLASSVNFDDGVANFWINDDYNTYTLVIQDDNDYNEDTYMFEHPTYWGNEDLTDWNDEKLTADQLLAELQKLPGADFNNYYGMREIFRDHPELEQM